MCEQMPSPRIRNGRTLLLAALLLWVVLPCAAAQDWPTPEPLSNFPTTELAITTPDARLHRFEVWVAERPARHAQGLMWVRELPEYAGMLFVYSRPQRISMWMKNTYLPLDMLFIAADGRVESIASRTTPLSRETISSAGEVLGVLELAGGTAERLGIRPGAVVIHPVFGTSPAPNR